MTAGPHRIDIKAATELGIAVAMTPAVSFASIAREYMFLDSLLRSHGGSYRLIWRCASVAGILSTGNRAGRKDSGHSRARKDRECGS